MDIVLLVGEDTGRHQGCYGDPLGLTPRIDALAAEGCRFTNAISHAPVCSPSRCGLVTGQYPTKIGTHHHRSRLLSPPRLFTHELRDAGYHVVWPKKTDFNFEPLPEWRDSDRPWVDDLANGLLPTDRPLLLYQNLELTHESGMWSSGGPAHRPQPVGTYAELDHLAPPVDPAHVPVPAYLPDTPEVRQDVARYYHRLAVQDLMVGRILDAIDASGRRDRTIVVYLTDHGRGLPREKRWLYEAGIHLPLIIRAPGLVTAGSIRDDLVAWVDIAPTLLSLAGAPIPNSYDGQVFLGPDRAERRRCAFAARDRMDETYDAVRAARDERYLYLRNLHPDLPYAQRNEYMEYMPSMAVLRELRAQGRLSGAASLLMTDTKPPEELYDTQRDPECVHNLAADEASRSQLARLRDELDRWMRQTGDLGLVPERRLIEQGLVDDELARMRRFVKPLPERYAIGRSLYPCTGRPE